MDGPARCLLEICEFWCLWKIIISSRCRYESRYNHQNIWVGYRCILSWTIIISVSFYLFQLKIHRNTRKWFDGSPDFFTWKWNPETHRTCFSFLHGCLWIKENVLLKNPTKSGIKAVKWILLCAQLLWVCWRFPVQKLEGMSIWMWFWYVSLFFLKWYTYINQIHKIAMYNNCCTAVHVV